MGLNEKNEINKLKDKRMEIITIRKKIKRKRKIDSRYEFYIITICNKNTENN